MRPAKRQTKRGVDRPLIHDKTAAEIETTLRANHHAIALIGPYGAGKSHLASWLAARLLGGRLGPASLKTVAPTGDSLKIDQIREVTSFLKLIMPGESTVRRVVIIEDAQAMTLEAQNAFLKTLEEPPDDTRLIVTATSGRLLLPTVSSRLHAINVLPVGEAQFSQYLKPLGLASDAIRRAFAISGGLAGLGLSLAQNKDHELLPEIGYAKRLLASSAYERLLEVDRLAKDKPRCARLLFALKRVLSAGLTGGQANNLDRLVNALKAVHAAEAALPKNPNYKILLTNLMLKL